MLLKVAFIVTAIRLSYPTEGCFISSFFQLKPRINQAYPQICDGALFNLHTHILLNIFFPLNLVEQKRLELDATPAISSEYTRKQFKILETSVVSY